MSNHSKTLAKVSVKRLREMLSMLLAQARIEDESFKELQQYCRDITSSYEQLLEENERLQVQLTDYLND